MTRQTIRLAAVKRACSWCGFVALARRSPKFGPIELDWFEDRRHYRYAVAWAG